MTAISICVCTFRRPDALLRLLRSLGRLDPATPAHEIIVVDNDAAMTAAPAIRQARAEGLEVRSAVEPWRGIARARNRSVEPAIGEYVAFIDDDEEAAPDWIVRLWDEVVRHCADGGIGPVVPSFDPPTPRWLAEGRFFERPRFPTGTILRPGYLRTGNALVRRRALMALPGPFDERYDLGGGEDTDLFARLIHAGARFIAVDDAVVYEHLPAARATVRWLLERRFRGAFRGAALKRETFPAGLRPWEGTRSLASGLASGALGLLSFPASRTYGLTRLVVAAQHLGRFALHSGISLPPFLRDWRG